MKFTETKLAGAFILDIEPIRDNRGFFARIFDPREFTEHGIEPPLAQFNLSYNIHKGTLRGMHFLKPPQAEAKLVRVIRGALLDQIVDIRPESPTYLQHISVELTGDNRRALYVPKGFAHGFQTLTDDTEVLYQMSDFYQPGADTGLRYDDPALGLSWPLPVSEISEKDAAWALLQN